MTRSKAQPSESAWFSAERSDLIKHLARLQSVSARGSTIPILTSVLLETCGGELRLAATDMDVSLLCSCPATSALDFSAAIKAGLLYNIIAKAPEGLVRFSLEGERLQVSYPNTEMSLGFWKKKEFPKLDSIEPGTLSISAGAMATLIRRSSPGIGKEESRYSLDGAQFRYNNGFEMCATNGEHAAVATEPGESEPFCFTIPRKALTVLAGFVKDGGDIRFADSANLIRFDLNGGTLIARKFTAQFPNIDLVVKNLTSSRDFTVGTAALVESIKRVIDLTDDKTRHVRLRFQAGLLEVSYVGNGDIGTGKTTIPIEYTGDELLLGLNYRYALDALGAVDAERCTIQTDGDSKPVAIKADGYLGIIVPIQPKFV